MKKRSGRPSRFTMIANEAIDDETLDLTQLGLHTFIVRCKDGYDIDMDTLAKRRGPGRRVLYAAMRALVERAYVVKVKYQGERGRWSTDVLVYDTPATSAEVAEVLEEYAAFASVRVEPEWIDPREKNAQEPPAEEDPQVAPACHNRQVGDRQVGGRQVKDRKTNTKTDTKTVHPSVGKAEIPAGESMDGRTGESAAEEKPPEAPPRVAVAPTEGVLLLTAIGNELPAFLLTGKVLQDQGRNVDGLLASGWTSEQIRHVVAGRPLPEKIKTTVGGIISGRILAASDSPAPSAAPMLPWQSQGWHDQDPAPDEETYTAPAFGEHIAPARFYECTGDDRGIPCGKPCDPVTGLCREHSGERPCPVSGCRRWTSNAGPCDTCVRELADAEAAFQRCIGAPPLIFNESTEAERLVDLHERLS